MYNHFNDEIDGPLSLHRFPRLPLPVWLSLALFAALVIITGIYNN